MGEVIAIPLTSECRATAVLAALRRLEAQYQVSSPASGGIPRRIAGRARVGSRRVLRELRRGAGDTLVGGIVGLTIAAAFASSSAIAPRLDGLLRGAGRSALGPALGLALRIATCLRASRGAPNVAEHDAWNVSWLVSYVTAEPDGSGSGRLRASVLRLTLPEAAEGRLRAILERAAATSAT
jgi:hypothetical protein